MKNLPIGQDSFENLIHDNCVYVDKTEYIYRILSSGARTQFLSRPRRFGKSLLLSTIKAVFEGKRELFQGLFIEEKIDWQPHPVIKLDMTKDAGSARSLRIALASSIKSFAEEFDVEIDYHEESPATMLERLIKLVADRTGRQLVILVDEYDKPILDVIENPSLAAEIRRVLQDFYVVFKSSSSKIRFLMLTGVSKINQLSIFSGLNQLSDLTLNTEYAGICGYTQAELEQYFDGYIAPLAEVYGYTPEKTYEQIKHWYNGYSWDGSTFVYNPFSVLNLFNQKRFKGYWFATGTPTFLLKLLSKVDDYSSVLADTIRVDYGFENQQTLENLKLVPLMFQTGYLTVKKDFVLDSAFELQLPNEEVRKALMESLVNDFVRHTENHDLYRLAGNLKAAFEKGDTALAVEYLRILYSNASYHQGIDNEGYYHNLFEVFCKFAGMDIRIESRTDTGRIDAVIGFADRTYIVEIKYSASVEELPDKATAALGQIEGNNYIQPYLSQDKRVHLLGLAFTKGNVGFNEKIV
ncbi:ATP-binding protein [Parapedobacter soli]|uniref:ATP-binding protein n=1 Tax=Parapedobacter soli TaxID=416955 RepID=UPI0021CA2DA4|nr:ATP-binding protein [Parapedobacter soli]